MVRSILAVMMGYLTFGLSASLLFGLSGRDPHVTPGVGFLVFAILYGVGFAALGGYLAATVGRRRQVAHAAAVAVIIGIAALVSLVAQAGNGAIWSELATLFLMAPAAVAGADLRRRSGGGAGSAQPGGPL